MRKGLSIRIVGGVTLALVGVSILIATFTTNFGGGQGFFCSTYESVSIVFPGKDSPPPKGCGESRSIEYEVIEVDSGERLSLELAEAIMSCWDEYEGYNTSGEFCEGWNVKEAPTPIGEEDVTQKLADNNLCPSRIQNSDIEHTPPSSPTCGSKNNIYFGIDEVSQGDFVTIEYNTTSSGTQRVEVE